MSNSRECDDGGKQAQHVNFLRVIEIATYQFVGKIPKYEIDFSGNVSNGALYTSPTSPFFNSKYAS